MRAPVLFTPQQRIGSDDGLVRAIELVVTPIVFAGFGWLLDRAFGTFPVLLIALASLAFVGKVVAEWYRYDNRMRNLEQHLTADRPTHARTLERTELDDGKLPEGVVLDTDAASQRGAQ